MQSSADMIVDLGSAADFMFLDISTNSPMDAVMSKGVFEGPIGWSGGIGSSLTIDRQTTVAGDIYLAADSMLEIQRKGVLTGTDYVVSDMSQFKADVDLAVSQFGSLTSDLDLGNIVQTGNFTINRTDAYTVVDIGSLQLSGGSLTLNGQTNDIFYIRVSDVFELNNVDIVLNGTDASRVFFIYEGTDNLVFDRGEVIGTYIAANAAVELSRVSSFEGSVISSGGLSVSGENKNTTFSYVPPIPEASAVSLILFVGGGAIYVRRFFKSRQVGSNTPIPG